MKIRFAFWLINLGIKLMPYEYQNDIFLLNCMQTKKIKVNLHLHRIKANNNG